MIRNSNVLLIQPPFHDLLFDKNPKGTGDSLAPPLGLMYLGKPLIRKGYNVDFIDFNVDKIKKDEFESKIREQKFILTSSYSCNLEQVKQINSIIKKVNNNAYTIFGGPHPTLSGEYIEGSNMTVKGEAEQSIDKILERVELNQSLDDIPGLMYRKNSELIYNDGILAVEDLDKSEHACFELAKDKDYGNFLNFKLRNVGGIMASRGCVFKCTFCTHRGKIKYRKRSVDSVLEELVQDKQNGYKYISFYDDNVTMHRKWFREIMKEVIKEKLKLKFIIQSRADNPGLEFYKILRKGGVLVNMMGFENPNQDVLDFYKKNLTTKKIGKSIEDSEKAGFFNVGYVILGSPLETKEHFEKTKQFVSEVPLDYLHVSILRYSPGSELHDEALEKGLVEEFEEVSANEKLSNFSNQEWHNMRAELLKSFWTHKRITKVINKSFKTGVPHFLLNFAWNAKNDLIVRDAKNNFIDKTAARYRKIHKK